VEQRKVKFQYKGSRSYIQGPDIFNVMIAGFPEGGLLALRFSVHGFVLSPSCDLYESFCKEDLNFVSDIRARCQFEHYGKMHYLALAEAPNSSLANERYAYDEDQIVSISSHNGEEIQLNERSPFTFIETVVAMNKYHHQMLFPNASGKWVFTRIDLQHDCHVKENIHLVFKNNMSFRLTKSDVLVNGEKVGDIYFSLVQS